MQIIDRNELGLVLDVVSVVLDDWRKNVSASDELHKEFESFCSQLGKPYTTFEQMIGARLNYRWPAGACYLSELKSYKREMLAELGDYLDSLDTAMVKKLKNFLSERGKHDFLMIDGSDKPLKNCFHERYVEGNETAVAVIEIIERHLLICKYIALCAEERDPVAVMKSMVSDGHSNLIDFVAPMFQLIAQQSNAPDATYEKTDRIISSDQGQMVTEVINRRHPDRKGVEKQDPYYFVLLKCPSCGASGNAVVRREDRGFCKCGQVFEIIRNMDKNQGLKDCLQEADEYVEQRLLETLKKEFKYGFDELDAQMKDLASRISGMAVNSEYKRKALQLEYELTALGNNTDDLRGSVEEINRRIDHAVMRICNDHKQDIINLIDEQSNALGDIQVTQQETLEATGAGRKENLKNFRILNDKIDESYGCIMDTLEMLNTLYDTMQGVQQTTKEIDQKTDEIIRKTDDIGRDSRETQAMLRDLGTRIAAFMGQITKESSKNQADAIIVQDFVEKMMSSLACGMNAQAEAIEIYLDNIMDMIRHPVASKYCCPWCKEEKLTTTEHSDILKCEHCGQIVSTRTYLNQDVKIPRLNLIQEDDDWYFKDEDVTIRDEIVVVNIPINAKSWLRDEYATSVVDKDISMTPMLQPKTLILVSDFECELNDAILYKLSYKLGSLTRIIIGAGVTNDISKDNKSWRYNKNTKQYTRKTGRKRG